MPVETPEQSAFNTIVPSFAVSVPSTEGNTDTLVLLNGTWLLDGSRVLGDNDP